MYTEDRIAHKVACMSFRKQLIDEDKRELMRFQEMYLPDGDLYSEGNGRMRRFRWNNNGEWRIYNKMNVNVVFPLFLSRHFAKLLYC